MPNNETSHIIFSSASFDCSKCVEITEDENGAEIQPLADTGQFDLKFNTYGIPY